MPRKKTVKKIVKKIAKKTTKGKEKPQTNEEIYASLGKKQKRKRRKELGQ